MSDDTVSTSPETPAVPALAPVPALTAAFTIKAQLSIKFSVNLPFVGHIDIANVTWGGSKTVNLSTSTAQLVVVELPAAGLDVLDVSTHGVTLDITLTPG